MNSPTCIARHARAYTAALAAVLLALVPGCASSHAPASDPQSSRSLFDGHTLSGWTPVGAAKWRVSDGNIVSDADVDGWLRTNEEYANFELSLEYRNPPKGNSGVFLRCPIAGSPYPAPEFGYELQLYNEDAEWATGSIEKYIQRLTPVSPAADVWHRIDIVADGPHFVIKIDGVKVLDGTANKRSAGYIGLQHHKESKTEFRAIQVRRLG
jgi:hypothetical protein